MKNKYIIGIDEVGRGCLAGPVVVAAVLFEKGKKIYKKTLGAIRESKKLTVLARERWFAHFREIGTPYVLAKVYPATIDRLNISRAANLAALRSFRRLLRKTDVAKTNVKVLLDGGLYLGSRGRKLNFAKTIIRGDEKVKAIAAASILAKVYRDKLMKRLAKEYPKYFFEIHKGYGTKKHIQAIRKHGPSPMHRKTFISKIIKIKK